MNRRAFLKGMSALAGLAVAPARATMPIGAAQAPASVDLLTCPVGVSGDWGRSLPSSALLVIKRMRNACLAGVMLISDKQPDDIRVDNHLKGPPHIWLHDKPPDQAWIIVDIGERDWSKLAYQFGHELGHVLCNSWQWRSKPAPPCQWLEESMVEAFSIHGLGRLATTWERNPPFAGDNAFANAIRDYRQNLINKYAVSAGDLSGLSLAEWFRRARSDLDSKNNLGPNEGPAIVAIASVFEGDAACVADLGALNRWPERSTVLLEQYLALWEQSCTELGAPGRLPAKLKAMLQVESSNAIPREWAPPARRRAY